MTVSFSKNSGVADPSVSANVDPPVVDSTGQVVEDTPELPPEEHRTRHDVKPNRRFSLRGMASSLVGRVGVGVAVTAVVLASMIGSPGATGRGVPVEVVATAQAPRGHQVERFTGALRELSTAIAPDGLEREEVMRALSRLSFSTTLVDGISPTTTGLEAQPNTRVTVSLSQSGFTIRAHPAMRWHADNAPDPRINSITYSFHNGAFSADAEGWGPDGYYRDGVANSLNQRLRPGMPADMQVAGYNPFDDGDLEQKVQTLVDLIVGHAAGTAPGDNTTNASDPRFGVSFYVDEEQELPLADGPATAFVEAGTRIDVDTRLDGNFGDPKLSSMTAQFSRDVGIVRGDDKDALFSRLDLRSITLRPDAQITMNYQLGPESAVDGLQALVALFAVAAEPRLALHSNGPSLQPSRMEKLRARVQERIDGQLEPGLVEAIQRYDDAIDGVSLARFFGLQPTDTVPE